jgi:hypothetical protein
MCLLLIAGIMSEDLQRAALTVSLAEFEKWSRPRCPPIVFPHLDCSEFSTHDAVWNFVGSGVASIQLTYPAIDDQLNFVQKFLSRVCPSDQYTSEVTETLAKQLHVGLVCGKLWTEPPPTLASFIKRFWREVYPRYRTRFRSIDPNCTEVFLFHHGLWRLPSRLKRRLRTKAILDVGLDESERDLTFLDEIVDRHEPDGRAGPVLGLQTQVVPANVQNRRPTGSGGDARVDDVDVRAAPRVIGQHLFYRLHVLSG